MTSEKSQHEPTMEEILASIRQIISEDGDESPVRSAGVDSTASVSQPLDLTQVVNEDGSLTRIGEDDLDGSEQGPGPTPESVVDEDLNPPAEWIEPSVKPEPDPEPAAPAPMRAPNPATETLISPERASAVQSALGRLTSQTRVRGPDPATLEGLVAELLRPMLKEWLDANLPDMVERSVREEIERIAARAGY